MSGTAGKDPQSCKFQLTINNPNEKGLSHKKIYEIFRDNFKTLDYLCMADEQGSCYHTHIFVVFASRVRFSMIKRYFEEAHIEKARGTVSQNISYIQKSGKWEDTCKSETVINGTFEEYGSRPPDSKGKRSDMSELYQMIVDGKSNAEILAINQDYILNIDKLDKLRTTLLQDMYKDKVRLDLKVIYISGETGTGKTRGVFEEHGYSNVYRVTDYDHPFDSYSNQPELMFDEFRSSIKLKDMLLYCDIYPVELPARYSNKYACYNRVYIISNWELERQYSELQKTDQESWKAFLRRIQEVWTYDKKGNVKKYNTVKEYFEREEEFIEVDENEEGQLPFNK